MPRLANPLNPDHCRDLVASPRWQSQIAHTWDHHALWTGKTSRGYGRIQLDGSQRGAHRIALVAHLGHDLHPEEQVDHLCHVRRCTEPSHLSVATCRDNLLSSPMTIAAQNATKIHCPRGHALTGANVIPRSNGFRSCVICGTAYSQVFSALQRALRPHGLEAKSPGRAAVLLLGLGIDPVVVLRDAGIDPDAALTLSPALAEAVAA